MLFGVCAFNGSLCYPHITRYNMYTVYRNICSNKHEAALQWISRSALLLYYKDLKYTARTNAALISQIPKYDFPSVLLLTSTTAIAQNHRIHHTQNCSSSLTIYGWALQSLPSCQYCLERKDRNQTYSATRQHSWWKPAREPIQQQGQPLILGSRRCKALWGIVSLCLIALRSFQLCSLSLRFQIEASV